MKLLVLGGTLFVGRHVVEAALDRGHEVTLFNRGRTNRELFPKADHLRGDREADLSAVAGGQWDAVVDPSGYVPRVVAASAQALADTAAHYTFVSSVSAYRDFSQRGISEGDALAELPEESEDVSTHYGALKARCEAVVDEHFGRRRAHRQAGRRRRPLRLDESVRLLGPPGCRRRGRPRAWA